MNDLGSASLAYVGAMVAVALVVTSVSAVFVAQAPIVGRAAKCAVVRILSLGHQRCDAGSTGTPGDPGDPTDPSDPTSTGSPTDPANPPTTCKDTVYANSTKQGSTHSNSSEYSRQLQVNCVWYPINPECVSLAGIPNWEPGKTIPADQKDALAELVACVTGGVGPPSANPDDIKCNKTTVMNGKITVDPPKAQFGCTEWVVPIECRTQWQKWQALPKDASPEYLRPGPEETMSKIFPQNDKGEFSKDALTLDFDTGGIGDLTETVGTTRNLDYDITVDEVSGGGGVSFAGLPLVSIKGGKVTEGRDLTGSSLDVIDVNGNKTKMTPSPKCHDKQIDPATYTYDKGPPYADRGPYEYK